MGHDCFCADAQGKDVEMNNPSNILIDGSKFGVDWLKIYWYGALIVLGVIMAYVLCSHEAKRRGYHKDCVIDLCLICVPLGAIFARIYYILFSLDTFIRPGMSFGETVWGIINIRDGGLAIYGAIIGGVIGMLIYSRIKKMHFLSLTDLVLPTVALAQAIGRWGNFFNQEAYGRVISEGFPPYFPLAVKIDECHQACCAGLPSNLGNIHYATFFYESCWCLLIFAALWFFVRKHTKNRGDITMTYLIMYGFERMIVEGLRTDSLMLGSIRVSQLLSALLVIFGMAFLITRTVLEKKRGHAVWPIEEAYYGSKPECAKREDNAEEESLSEGGEPSESESENEASEADSMAENGEDSI